MIILDTGRRWGVMAGIIVASSLAGSSVAAEPTRTMTGGAGQLRSGDPTSGTGIAVALDTRVRTGGVRAHRSKWADRQPNNRLYRRVEFVDSAGVVRLAYELHGKRARREVSGIIVDADKGHVGVLERIGGEDLLRRQVFTYLDSAGKAIWSADICVGDDALPGDILHISADGRIVVLADAVPGEECIDGDSAGIYRAPEGCVGVRVFEASGELLYSRQRGRGAYLSVNGAYLVFEDASDKSAYRLEIRTGKLLKLPQAKDRRPQEVSDTGTVHYWDTSNPKGYKSPLMDYNLERGLHEAGK